MTVAEWIENRASAAPPDLVMRIRAALGNDGALGAASRSAVCLSAAERLLAEFVRDGGANRECALDLLAADALVTYAFQAASEHPDALRLQAERAMARIASLALSGGDRA